MSKNTNVNGFRKINIDAFDPENYIDDDQGIDDEMGPNEQEVVSLLNSRQNFEALNVVLSNPPLNTKNQVVKDAAFQLVLRVLKSIQNGSEIEKAVKQLDMNAVDVLMKYIYKGFEKESNNSSILLNWHEKVHAVGGPGCIVRVLSDGKRV